MLAFRVKKPLTTGQIVGQIVDGNDFTELERLVRKGILEPCDGVELPKRPMTIEECLDEIERLHKLAVDAEKTRDDFGKSCESALARVRADNDRLKKEIDGCYSEITKLEKSLNEERSLREHLADKAKTLEAKVAELQGLLSGKKKG